jgi:hypothetical protein
MDGSSQEVKNRGVGKEADPRQSMIVVEVDTVATN